MITIPLVSSTEVLGFGQQSAAANVHALSVPSRRHTEPERIATAIVYCEANFGAIDGKIANGLVRHSEKYKILSVIDSKKAGQDSGETLGETVNGIPIYRDLTDALAHINCTPDYFIIGMAPDTQNMTVLCELADAIDAKFGAAMGAGLEIISGGNSANLSWALNSEDTGRVNDLRLGESLLLGLEPLHRQPVDGLYTEAITLVAEVIESKIKPSQPWGEIAQTAFGDKPMADYRGHISQTIVAIGHQDTDPEGLTPPAGMDIIGASGDHVILDTNNRRFSVGSEIDFQLNYCALLRAMTSPFVTKIVGGAKGQRQTRSA